MEQGQVMPLSAPVLRNDQITLRPVQDEDAQAILEQCLDPVTQAWTPISGDFSQDDARRWIRHLVPAGWESGLEHTLAIEYDGRYAGSVSLKVAGDRTAEISFGLHPDFRGRSLTAPALRVFLDWAFAELNLNTVKWLAVKGNWASRKVAWRLGFSFDGTLRGWLPSGSKPSGGEATDQLVDAWAGSLIRNEPLAPRTEWFDVPTIEDPLVRLRRVRGDDLERIVSGANDPLNQEWIRKLDNPYTPAQAESYLAGYEEGMASGVAVHWAMADPSSDDFLGTMSILRIARPQGEVGYWSHPQARGRGLVTQAARLAIAHAFTDLGLERLCLYAATDNTASWAIAQRCGFTRVGTERRMAARRSVGLVDCEVFDLLPEDLM